MSRVITFGFNLDLLADTRSSELDSLFVVLAWPCSGGLDEDGNVKEKSAIAMPRHMNEQYHMLIAVSIDACLLTF